MSRRETAVRPTPEPAPAPEPTQSRSQPLDGAVSSHFHQTLGFDFAKVKIHTDTPAQRAAAAMDANAYTTGNDIYFGTNRYRPGTAEGRWLLAHEAFHVAHQNRARIVPGIAPEDSRAERMADEFANEAIRGGGSFRDWGDWRDAGPAWSIHPDRITRRGAVAHTGAVGANAGVAVGAVEVRTGEDLETDGGAAIANRIALEYSGALSADSRWLQFVWFELVATLPDGTEVRTSDTVSTTSGVKPFTVDPTAPEWSVDSGSTTDPFYDARGRNIRTSSSTTIFDAPGGGSVTPLAAALYAAQPTATAVRFRAHFETFLIQNRRAAYRVTYSATTAFTRAANGTVSAAAIGYTVGASGPVTAVPDDFIQLVYASYPSPWDIQ